jgi:hypothetical protein
MPLTFSSLPQKGEFVIVRSNSWLHWSTESNEYKDALNNEIFAAVFDEPITCNAVCWGFWGVVQEANHPFNQMWLSALVRRDDEIELGSSGLYNLLVSPLRPFVSGQLPMPAAGAMTTNADYRWYGLGTEIRKDTDLSKTEAQIGRTGDAPPAP